jgi:hypothetical protein
MAPPIGRVSQQAVYRGGGETKKKTKEVRNRGKQNGKREPAFEPGNEAEEEHLRRTQTEYMRIFELNKYLPQDFKCRYLECATLKKRFLYVRRYG